MRVVKVGVVGLNMGRNYANSFQEYERSELVAVCDFNSEVLERVTDEMGVKGYLSFSEMVKDSEIDALAIVSPSYEHATMGHYAALHGKHIMIDKPIATDLNEGDKLIEVCKTKGVKLAGVFQSRLDPKNIRMKRILENNELGRIFLVEGVVKWWRDDGDYYHKSKEVEMWKGSWFGEGGGALINQGIHTVDLLRWLIGDVDTVYGHYDTIGHNIQAEDFSTALINFKNGVVGYMVCTTCAPREMQETRVSIYGTKGMVSRIGDNLFITVDGITEKISNGQELKIDTLSTQRGGPHDWLCRDFVDSILDDRDPIVTGESALQTVEIVKAVYKSAMQGIPVKIPLPRY